MRGEFEKYPQNGKLPELKKFPNLGNYLGISVDKIPRKKSLKPYGREGVWIFRWTFLACRALDWQEAQYTVNKSMQWGKINWLSRIRPCGVRTEKSLEEPGQGKQPTLFWVLKTIICRGLGTRSWRNLLSPRYPHPTKGWFAGNME